jgi:hypothetical protein
MRPVAGALPNAVRLVIASGAPLAPVMSPSAALVEVRHE